MIVAMSGGVDSSVAAALLKRQGYKCTGVFMCLGQGDPGPDGHQSCCSPADAADARLVADRLGIDFYVLDFQRELEKIIEYFVAEYRRGRTPNPCIKCNSHLKFGKLAQYAQAVGAQYVATGHYAQIVDVAGQKRLARGVDLDKDQSYALFDVARDKLPGLLFPVGGFSKTDIRQLAQELKLPVHDKAESQEICFVPDDDYGKLVAQRAPQICQPGQVVDTAGEVLGEHAGIYKYTIGQRRGLGIALGEPAYVVRLDVQENRVVLGSRADLLGERLWAGGVNWLIDPAPAEPLEAVVQIRYNHRGAAAIVKPLNAGDDDGATGVVVDFSKPVSAITPGQAAVFYDEHQAVVGGGWIDRAGPM